MGPDQDISYIQKDLFWSVPGNSRKILDIHVLTPTLDIHLFTQRTEDMDIHPLLQ